jgi:hypothetical protein
MIYCCGGKYPVVDVLENIRFVELVLIAGWFIWWSGGEKTSDSWRIYPISFLPAMSIIVSTKNYDGQKESE